MTWDTTTIQVHNTGVTGFNFNHTIGAGINRWARVFVFNGGSSITVTGTPTFGGVAMTPVTSLNPHVGDPIFGNIYAYDAVAPASGVNAVAGNFSGTTTATIVVISRDEVNQTTPCDAVDLDTPFEDNNAPSATTASEVGDEVVSIVATAGADTPANGGSITVTGSGQVLLDAEGNTGENHVIGASYSPGGATVTQSWDLSAIGGAVSGYFIQFNINTDGAPPPPDKVFDPLRTYRPRPFCPGSIR